MSEKRWAYDTATGRLDNIRPVGTRRNVASRRCARLLHLRHGEDPDATLYHQLVDGRGQRLFSH